MSFVKSRGESLLQYEIKAELVNELADAIVADIKVELEKDPTFQAVVLNTKSFEVNYKVFKNLIPLGLELRKLNKQVYILSEKSTVGRLIRSEGLDKTLKPILALTEIPDGIRGVKSPPKMDVSFINPFVEGTIHVLKVQCQTDSAPTKPLLKGQAGFQSRTDIAGIIGITSQKFTGSIAICFPEKVFLNLMSKMLGEEFTEITNDLEDGAGELLNMIFGHAKKILNENGHSIEKALPTVVRAANLNLNHAGSQDSIILPFMVGELSFFMEIGIDKT